MSSLPSGSIDMAVTSPPYDNLRTYNEGDSWTFETFKEVATQLVRLLKLGGALVWNVNDATKDGSESGTSFRQVLHFMSLGLLLADTMIYQKANPGGARGSNKTYIQSFEYMFVFSKGPLTTYNLIQDRPNKRPGAQTGGGRRNKDGTNAPTKTYASAEMGRRFNIWTYPTEVEKTGHPAPFPLALALDHILSWSNKGDVVLDPFGGSGTTAVAAINAGRRWVCIERDEGYAEKAMARISQHESGGLLE